MALALRLGPGARTWRPSAVLAAALLLTGCAHAVVTDAPLRSAGACVGVDPPPDSYDVGPPEVRELPDDSPSAALVAWLACGLDRDVARASWDGRAVRVWRWSDGSSPRLDEALQLARDLPPELWRPTEASACAAGPRRGLEPRAKHAEQLARAAASGAPVCPTEAVRLHVDLGTHHRAAGAIDRFCATDATTGGLALAIDGHVLLEDQEVGLERWRAWARDAVATGSGPR
mgnify:FL=1